MSRYTTNEADPLISALSGYLHALNELTMEMDDGDTFELKSAFFDALSECTVDTLHKLGDRVIRIRRKSDERLCTEKFSAVVAPTFDLKMQQIYLWAMLLSERPDIALPDNLRKDREFMAYELGNVSRPRGEFGDEVLSQSRRTQPLAEGAALPRARLFFSEQRRDQGVVPEVMQSFGQIRQASY